MINLSPEKDKVFDEIARVLKPGGHMAVSDMVARDLPEALCDNPVLYDSCIAGAISEEAYLEGLSRAGLVDVEVRERIAYDAAQLKALAESECCCAAGPEDRDAVQRLLAELAGNIWSAKFFARKP